MKIKLLLTVLSILLLTSLVSAAVDITETSVELAVDYRGFDQEDQITIAQTGTFTLNNPDATDAVVRVSIAGLPADYTSATINDVTITNGSTKSVSFTINVPHKENPGKKDIGFIVIKDTSGVELDRATLVQNTSTMLIIKEIKVDYTDEDDDNRDDDFDAEENDRFSLNNDVKVGSELSFIVEVENLFRDKDYDGSEIEEIELTIDSSDNDIFPDNFDDEFRIGDLQAKDSDKVTITWDIPDDADAGDYTIEFTLKGEDRENVKYEVRKEISFDLRRKRDDIRITRAELIPNSLTTCGSHSFSLEVQMKNFGTDDQKDAGIAVFNSELGINENIREIELQEYDDRDDTWNRIFRFNLPANVAAKTYPLEILPFLDRNEAVKNEEEIVNLVVKACPAIIPVEPEPLQAQNQPVIVTTQPILPATPTTADNLITSNAVANSVEKAFNRDDLLIAGLFIAILAIIGVMILFLILLLKR